MYSLDSCGHVDVLYNVVCSLISHQQAVSLIIINHDTSQDLGSERRPDDKHLRPKGRAVDFNLAAPLRKIGKINKL